MWAPLRRNSLLIAFQCEWVYYEGPQAFNKKSVFSFKNSLRIARWVFEKILLKNLQRLFEKCLFAFSSRAEGSVHLKNGKNQVSIIKSSASLIESAHNVGTTVQIWARSSHAAIPSSISLDFLKKSLTAGVSAELVWLRVRLHENQICAFQQG